MFDDDAEVRDAAGEALGQVGDPSVPAFPTQRILIQFPLPVETSSLESLPTPIVEAFDDSSSETDLVEADAATISESKPDVAPARTGAVSYCRG